MLGYAHPSELHGSALKATHRRDDGSQLWLTDCCMEWISAAPTILFPSSLYWAREAASSRMKATRPSTELLQHINWIESTFPSVFHSRFGSSPKSAWDKVAYANPALMRHSFFQDVPWLFSSLGIDETMCEGKCQLQIVLLYQRWRIIWMLGRWAVVKQFKHLLRYKKDNSCLGSCRTCVMAILESKPWEVYLHPGASVEIYGNQGLIIQWAVHMVVPSALPRTSWFVPSKSFKHFVAGYRFNMVQETTRQLRACGWDNSCTL